MDPEETVSQWLPGVKEGDEQAVDKVWQRYFPRLVGLARQQLESIRHPDDEEDVALSAFQSFCSRAADGKFPQLADREDLWRLLMTITLRKAWKVRRKAFREANRREPELLDGDLASADPTPEFAARVADEFRRLLGLLPDQDYRTVALAKYAGYSNQEIAQQHDRSISWVERKLQSIRQLWGAEL